MSWAPRCVARWREALRGSMTVQIWLSITLMSTLLVAGSSTLVLSLSRKELGDVADVVLLAKLVQLRRELADDHELLPRAVSELVQRSEQLGSLQVAVLDEQQRTIAASDHFELPLSALPLQPLAAAELPERITTERVRKLQRERGRLTTDWTAPDGRIFRVVLGRIALPAIVGGRGETVLAVLALDAAPARELTRQGATVIAVALLLSALTAGGVGVWLARRIVVAARRLGSAAGRIDGHSQRERLDVGALPVELREAGEAFNRMLDRLQAAYTRLSEFSSDLAHDLRTPINNLLGEAQVALSRPRDAAEYRAVLESAVEDYERLSRWIENMLFLARADHADAALQREWIDAQDLGVRAREYFESLAEERGVRLAFEWRAGAPAAHRLWADRTLLARAVGNLLSNALRYAPAGSTVTLGVMLGGNGAAQIAVTNTGPAIPAALHGKIFERLFRADPARVGSAQGSGLGLAIVKSILDLHGGSVAVRSSEACTVFTLWFPAPAPLPAAPAPLPTRAG